jgi:ABC-type Mn2+/Zn2+ transport system ATPase subunit
MKDGLQKSTRYFQTYEEREEAFRESVFSLIPRKYSGPKLFWKDYSRISLAELSKITQTPIAYITSYPRDCLAFGTPWQVLRAAILCAQKSNPNVSYSVEEIAKDFGVHENLFQPIRTLSGGETVKLALAKAFVSSQYSSRLSIASPFCWLSRDNTVFLGKLIEQYQNLGTPVNLFALEGEDSHTPISHLRNFEENKTQPVAFTLCLKDVRISLSSALNPIYAKQTFARIEDIRVDLASPCLIVGENGQGKSLIAKTLADAIPCQGTATIQLSHGSGSTRLLFQDVITQTLSRSFNGLVASSLGHSDSTPLELYDRIMSTLLCYQVDVESDPAQTKSTNSGDFRSILEIKAILVAVRLCGKPAALILDEPDWGLSRSAAIAFVLAIIEIAHALGIPVVLISHKSWWHPIAKNTIHVNRSAKSIGHDKTSFWIRLRCE